MALVIPLAMHAQTCEISYTLRDTYGDGWNGNYIIVRDVATNEIIARWTISSGNTANGTLSVSNGQVLQFEWTNGNYNKECSYFVYGVNGGLIFEGAGLMSGVVNYTVNCNGCFAPRGLNVSDIVPNSAVLNWTGDANQYNVRYREIISETPDFFDDFENGLSNWTIIRKNNGNEYTDWILNNVTQEYSHSGNYVVMSRSYDSQDPHLVDNWLITPQVQLDGVLKFWVRDDGMYHDHYNVYVSTGSNSINDFTLLYEPGDASATWTEVTVDLSSFGGAMGYIALRHIDYDQNYLLIDDFGIYTRQCGSWTEANVNTNSLEINNLSPSTAYQWQVQAICGGENVVSSWSGSTFSTESTCTPPSRLSTTDVLSDAATLGWHDYVDNYNIRYREISFFEGFEDGIPSNWIKIDYDGDGNNWLAVSEIPTNYSEYSSISFTENVWTHSGNDAACSPSFVTGIGAFNSNHWLITPLVNLQGMLSFYVKGSYSDEYEVLLSTSGTEPSNFNTTLQTTRAVSSNWEEVNIDLSQYAGRSGYIAIHHVFSDGHFLLLDDFVIYTDDWHTTTATDNTITISGLNPNTHYQWQVQGITSDCNDGITRWSNFAYFTTASPTMEITANQWYAISSPMHDIGHDYLGLSNVTGLTNGSYDLFRYNESTGTWENQKYSESTAAGFATLEGGRGYIYRRATDATLSFSGEPNTGSFTNSLTSSCADNDLKGFNLIGNPYPHAIYKGGAFPSTGLSDGYYSLEPDGTWYAREDSDPIAMGQAVLVQASSSVNLAFSNNASAPSEGAKAYGEKSLRFAVGGLGYEDVAYARFSNGEGLRKIAHLNTEAPSLSIPQKGTDYAIAALESTTGDFPLSFHTATYGQFTLTVSGNTHFPYLHLFDRLTGRDIDLRAENSYTFSGAPADLAERFLISLSPGIDNAAFAYQNGNSIVVNGEGELQVFDVAGRRLSSLHLDGSRTCDRDALGIQHSGVYLLRLIGKEHKTQKLIVR